MTPQQKARKWMSGQLYLVIVMFLLAILVMSTLGIIWISTTIWLVDNGHTITAGVFYCLAPATTLTIIGVYIKYRDKVEEYKESTWTR